MDGWIFIAASAASYSVNRWIHVFWHKTNLSMFLVDTVTLVAFYLVAARSRHWWPLWVVAFQLNAVASHLATMISPDFSNAVYRGYGGLLGDPMRSCDGLRDLARPRRRANDLNLSRERPAGDRRRPEFLPPTPEEQRRSALFPDHPDVRPSGQEKTSGPALNLYGAHAPRVHSIGYKRVACNGRDTLRSALPVRT